MKLSRKAIAAISTAAAIVVAGTVAGCKKDDEDPYHLINVDGDNASVAASNDGSLAEGEADAGADGKVAKSPSFIRGFQTPSTLINKKGALYKLTINKSSANGVLGWIFDEEKKEAKDTGAAEDTYSFYLLGVKATETNPSVYLSRFNDVTQSGLSGSSTTFGTEYTMIDSTKTDSSQAASGSKWYYKLDGSADGTEAVTYNPTDGNASIFVGYKQVDGNGRYEFGIFKCNTATEAADLATAKAWYNSNKKSDEAEAKRSSRLVPTLNAVNAAESGKTFKANYDSDSASASVTNTINDFGIALAGTSARSTQIGFYAMIPAKGSLNGKWELVEWDRFEDEVVEE